MKGIEIKVSKTAAGTHMIKVFHNRRSVGRVYLKPNGLVTRFHVSEGYRGKGVAKKLMNTLVDVFGHMEMYGYASPNRNSKVTEDNLEEYRERLLKVYSKYGFKRTGNGAKVIRKAN